MGAVLLQAFTYLSVAGLTSQIQGTMVHPG
jgi:hypothetical protein